MIKMVISPEYFGNNDKKSRIKAQLRNLGAYEINVDDESGFVTAVMTQDNYENFVEGLKKRIEKVSEDTPCKYVGVKEVKHNPDYTVFNVMIDKLSDKDKKSVVFDLYTASATYQVISGIPQSDTSIKVKFYNTDNKLVECIDTSKR